MKPPATQLGLGLAALGRPAYINLGHAQDLAGSLDVESMRLRAHQVLDCAWNNGVRYFDVARSYGLAEQFLSSWLIDRGIPPNAAMVGSKWGYTYTADWRVRLSADEPHEVKSHTLAVLQRQVKESRELLGPHLDLYQIHSATRESGVLKNQGILSRLAELRDEGLAIGFSVSGPGQSDIIRMGIEIERNGEPLFQSVQATWNLLEPSAGPALSDAFLEGRRVIVKEALANGRLTTRDSLNRPFNDKLSIVAERQGVTIDAIALAAALRQPWSSTVLSGAATTEHLLSNLTACAVKDDDFEELLSFREPSQVYWQRRAELSWN